MVFLVWYGTCSFRRAVNQQNQGKVITKRLIQPLQQFAMRTPSFENHVLISFFVCICSTYDIWLLRNRHFLHYKDERLIYLRATIMQQCLNRHCQTVCMMRIQMIRLLLVIFFMHLHVTSNKLKQETQLLRALMKTTPLLLATCSYQETYFTPLLARKKFRKRGNKDGL